ncbi:exonuclease [Paenimyroides tangerinum]|uniref:Exonuclease n=1 Tax=Paenimyroides tangerinum TaxID=2488728 RepID=A0A3P3W6E2_9FLAO|nr:exonuclease domain-containing protein [Paenimyroides tangerinum]RRJ89546.1 exonuclease [Paenimyroides tangerinum]
MYAIIDIETTGGQFNAEGITEIAIYKFDGVELVDQFISLVNPEIPIQPFVVKLTGINNAMLRTAPKFYEIAKRIIEITQDCIIVAHNASFDYRVLKMEFKRLGYDFMKQTLCTVELSKQLLPDVKTYSLGKLVRSLGIPIADRHRASGDAMATLKLFKLLLSKDLEKTILRTLIKNEIKNGISPKLLDILENLPTTVGIFYIHNEKGEIILIGRSNNIRKKISQYFTADTKIGKRIQNEVFTVTFEETGNELIALLKEREEIIHNKPVLNKVQRKSAFLFGVYLDKDVKGKYQLEVRKIDGRKKDIYLFKNQQEAAFYLHKKNEELTEKIPSDLSLEEYNIQFLAFVKEIEDSFSNIIVSMKGRNISEKSALIMENGAFKGYCFYDLNYQISNPSVLKNIVIQMPNTKDSRNIIKYYLYKKNDCKIIPY